MGERDADVMEGDELWFVLAGVEYPEDAMLRDKLIQTFLQGPQGRVKGVVLKVTKGDQSREDALQAMRRALAGVQEGDIRIL